ncbi:RHS repeat domain-containing protein, partial [Bacillus sp. HC-Mk]
MVVVLYAQTPFILAEYSRQQPLSGVRQPGLFALWRHQAYLLARHSPAGRVEKFEYNAAHGQLSRYTAADGAEWLYRYDERGLFSNITDPAGQTWTQLCDERGLPVSLVSPAGSLRPV